MSKNNFLSHKLLTKTNIAILCMVLMMAGFLVSRALLSVSVIGFIVAALYRVHPREWLKQKWWLLSLSWIGLYILSFFWSDNKAIWAGRLEIKLVIIFFPLAFSLLPAFTVRQLQVLTVSICALLLCSLGYSLSFLVSDYNYYIGRYYMSNVLPVLGEGDHIRYSLTLALFSVWCIYFWPHLRSAGSRWFIAVSVLIFVAFLHVLAARTGLLSLYLFVFVAVFAFGLRKGKLLAVAATGLLLAVMYLLITNVPTLKKKSDYFFYSIERYKEGDRSGNYSDIGRIMSYDLGLRLIKEHPMLGVGSGDMKAEMAALYQQRYPEVNEENVLLPHNQFMIIALVAGIPAMLLFAIWVFAPLGRLRRNRESMYFFCVWIMLFTPLLVEPLLEVQFGVFVYLFFLLLQRHVLVYGLAEDRNDFITANPSNDQLHSHISPRDSGVSR